MPRTARASVGGICYHVLNRGNAREEVFHAPGDYHAFIDLLAPACRRVPMRVLAYCLMPNHFHLCLWPHQDGDVGRWMQWLMTSHVRRHHPPRRQRSRLGRAVQGLPCSERLASTVGAAVHRAQPAAGRPGGLGAGMALVQLPVFGWSSQTQLPRRWPGPQARRLDRLGPPTAVSGGTGRHPPEHRARQAVGA